jgi:hypothetical protein
VAFDCPKCSTPDALEITLSLTLPPDLQNRDILLQKVICKHCHFEGLAVYREARQGDWDNETWDHTGYFLTASQLAAVSAQLESCPKPNQAYCNCPAHVALRVCDEHGMWIGLQFLETEKSFCMHLT